MPTLTETFENQKKNARATEQALLKMLGKGVKVEKLTDAQRAQLSRGALSAPTDDKKNSTK